MTHRKMLNRCIQSCRDAACNARFRASNLVVILEIERVCDSLLRTSHMREEQFTEVLKMLRRAIRGVVVDNVSRGQWEALLRTLMAIRFNVPIDDDIADEVMADMIFNGLDVYIEEDSVIRV